MAQGVLGMLMFTVMFYVGFILCFVPGIIVGLMFWPFFLLIVDRNASAVDSLGIARRITTGNKMTMLLAFILFWLISLAGVLACYVGIFVAMPFCYLATAVAYLGMSGQPTAADAMMPR